VLPRNNELWSTVAYANRNLLSAISQHPSTLDFEKRLIEEGTLNEGRVCDEISQIHVDSYEKDFEAKTYVRKETDWLK
jgi:hypothetical protein